MRADKISAGANLPKNSGSKPPEGAHGPDPYFNDIPDIAYEGPDSDNPFAFRYYNPEQVVLGKTMAEWCRFAVCYWHTFRGAGADPFGPGTMVRPWEGPVDDVDNAVKRAEVGV